MRIDMEKARKDVLDYLRRKGRPVNHSAVWRGCEYLEGFQRKQTFLILEGLVHKGLVARAKDLYYEAPPGEKPKQGPPPATSEEKEDAKKIMGRLMDAALVAVRGFYSAATSTPTDTETPIFLSDGKKKIRCVFCNCTHAVNTDKNRKFNGTHRPECCVYKKIREIEELTRRVLVGVRPFNRAPLFDLR